jgi:Tfp pilus assembly protein PilE
MKFFHRNKHRGGSLLELILVVAVLALFCAFAIPNATAQIPVGSGLTTRIAPAQVYWLTNANTCQLTNASGGTNLATASLTLINSTPFPLKPGRGFAYHLEFVGTNSNTEKVTPFFQVATPVINGSTLTTNWSQYIPGTQHAANGTTRVYAFGVIPITTIDNAQICRLGVLSNGHSASTSFSVTNSYVVEQ